MAAWVVVYRKNNVLGIISLEIVFFFYNAELHEISVGLKILAISLGSKISTLSSSKCIMQESQCILDNEELQEKCSSKIYFFFSLSVKLHLFHSSVQNPIA